VAAGVKSDPGAWQPPATPWPPVYAPVRGQIFMKISRGMRNVGCDNGLTLSPEQLTNVWTPYYQGEKYFTGEAQGMGLGLALVATLVWNVGGTCTLSNQADGSGVVVGLLVPLVKQ
jgi:nitrogen fixation/metabolism regulation signal transduction histidine kinase